EYCAIHFKELLNKSERSKTEINKLTTSIHQLSADLAQNKKRLSEDELELDKWKRDFDLKDINRSKLEDYQIILKVLSFEEDLSKLTERIPAGEKFLKEVSGSKIALNEQLLEKRSTLKLKKSALPDLDVLSEIRAWFVNYKHQNELLKKETVALENKNAEQK